MRRKQPRRKGLFRLRVLHQWLKKKGKRAKNQAQAAGHVQESQQPGAVESAETRMQEGSEQAGQTALDLTRISFARYRAMQAKRTRQLETAEACAVVSSPGEVPKPQSTPPRQMHPYQQKVLKQRAASRYYHTKRARRLAARPLYSSLPPGTGTAETGKTVQHTEKRAGRLVRGASALLRRAGRAIAAAVPVTLTAGSAAIVVVAAVGTATLLLGGPFGILLSEEAADPDGIPIGEIVAEINRQVQQKIDDAIEAHPACETVEYGNVFSWQKSWPEVLALFAVETSLSDGQQVLVLDEAAQQNIEIIFWEMHTLKTRTETQDIPQSPQLSPDEKSEAPERSQTLYLTLESQSVDAIAAAHGFTPEQIETLHQLLSPQLRPSLAALCSPSGLLWPLPGYGNISTRFGVPDAFGRPGHKGIDIPAPAGTPVLAAQDGMVVLAAESTSYGLQVLLDDGSTSTRYAHLDRIAVQAGQTAARGSVIGYVGSTGMSTGNHLHFELRQNGSLVDPLLYIPAG